VFEHEGTTQRVECDYLLSTIPICEFVDLFPQAPDDVRDAARGLRYRAMILLYLIVKKEQVFRSPWVYFSDARVIFNRLYEIGNFSRQMVRDGETALCLEITCDRGDATWNCPDSDLYDRALSYLERHDLLHRIEVSEYFTKRLESAYPIYEVGYRERLRKVMDFLRGFKRVATYGRQGGFAYINVDQCLERGFRIARRIVEGEADHGDVTLDGLLDEADA
jgi:protoporphyrinogen oxidase